MRHSLRGQDRRHSASAYNISSQRGGVVVLSEIYYPGWEAKIDGKPIELGRANYILRALRVPAGNHVVELKYEPASVATTETIAFIAMGIILMAFIAAVFFAVHSRRKTEKVANA